MDPTYIRSLAGEIEALQKRLAAAGLRVDVLEYPPACCDTPAQVAKFAATLPALRVAVRCGAWGPLRDYGVCLLGFCLAWCLSRLDVPRAWRAVRVLR